MSNEVIVHSTGGSAMMLNKEVFEQAYRAAKLFAASKLVPLHFQGKEPDCFIGLMVAHRMGEDPLTVLQNMYVVHGRPGWSTQYMIARANSSGVFKGRITWDVTGTGDAMSVKAKATLAETGQVVTSPAVDMKMAKAEGWTKNAKYQTMPELMLSYRSAAFLIRMYAPEVMLGYQTVEELETVPAMKDVTPEDSIIANINAQITGEKPAPQEVAPEEPDDTPPLLRKSKQIAFSPKTIPANFAAPGEADWPAWEHAFCQMCALAPDKAQLEALHENNAKLLGQMREKDPERAGRCVEVYHQTLSAMEQAA